MTEGWELSCDSREGLQDSHSIFNESSRHIKISFEFFLSSQSLKTVNLDEITSFKKGYFLIQILEYIFILFFYYCADENVQKLQNRQIFLKKNIQSVEDMLTIINLQAICQQAMVGIPNKAGYYCK